MWSLRLLSYVRWRQDDSLSLYLFSKGQISSLVYTFALLNRLLYNPEIAKGDL